MRNTRRRVVTITAATLAACAAATAPEPALACPPPNPCVSAWQQPRSTLATDCRIDGWTVRPRIVVGPRHWVRYSSMPHCRVEDTGALCTWNVGVPQDGNGDGLSFWRDIHGAPHYVKVPQQVHQYGFNCNQIPPLYWSLCYHNVNHGAHWVHIGRYLEHRDVWQLVGLTTLYHNRWRWTGVS